MPALLQAFLKMKLNPSEITTEEFPQPPSDILRKTMGAKMSQIANTDLYTWYFSTCMNVHDINVLNPEVKCILLAATLSCTFH